MFSILFHSIIYLDIPSLANLHITTPPHSAHHPSHAKTRHRLHLPVGILYNLTNRHNWLKLLKFIKLFSFFWKNSRKILQF